MTKRKHDVHFALVVGEMMRYGPHLLHAFFNDLSNFRKSENIEICTHSLSISRFSKNQPVACRPLFLHVFV